jgi:2-(1,2-epoxy-1,2-dihydrophenyl)acetyl-CoA isomerase
VLGATQLRENLSMNEPCTVTRYQVEAGVATITLQRPEAMNAFNAALRKELLGQIRRAEGEGDVRVVVLTGTANAFSAGADLKEPYNPPHEKVESMIIEEYKPLLDAIAGSTKPYVAAVQGPAAGIGMSFALNCDLMLMAEEAYLYSAFAPIALVPDGGATWHLVRAMGYKRAYQTIIEGRKIPAAECLALGLANQVTKSEGFQATVLAYAKDLAQRAPLALRYSKQLARSAMCTTLDTCIRDEAALQNVTIASRDAREAVQAFFEKRHPVFQGR